MPNTNYYDVTQITTGPAMVLSSPLSPGAPSTVTAVASPAPTTTSFAVSAADAAKLKTGDRLQLAATANTYTVEELSTLPVIVSIGTQASPVITVSPAFSGAPPTTAGGIRRAWENRGATDGGVELYFKKDASDQFIDQATVAVGATDQKLDIMLKAPLAEANFGNLALVAGVPDPVSGALSFHSADPGRYDRYAFIGPAPNNQTLYAVINKGKSKGAATHKADKQNKAIYALEVQGYADSSMTPDTLKMITV